jgi:hypothetical protein
MLMHPMLLVVTMENKVAAEMVGTLSQARLNQRFENPFWKESINYGTTLKRVSCLRRKVLFWAILQVILQVR